jgi:hypothetical protein
MSLARRRAIVIGLAVVIAAAALAIGAMRWTRRHPSVDATQPRPTLLLLTSLPLMFGEGFSLHGGGSPAFKALQSRYQVLPISVTNAAELAKGRLLLMAQPQAQSPESLVALDEWVRGGGRLLMLADPLLEWPSSRPLGDPLRPPVMFVDTGLLAHWGLRLDAPDRRGPAERDIDGGHVLTVSPGALYGACEITSDKLVAHCRVGRGQVTVVADADLLDVTDLGSGGERNLDALLAELARIDQK